jgi:indole-3-glycerol phosphate synthase
LDRVLVAGAQIIGVNNRDLQDFSVHLKTSLDLIREIPDECIAVSESGLSTREDIGRLRDAGFDAFLIGEHLMQQDDPAQALIDLIGSSDLENLAG